MKLVLGVRLEGQRRSTWWFREAQLTLHKNQKRNKPKKPPTHPTAPYFFYKHSQPETDG